MSVIAFIESENNVIKKSGWEAASYGRAVADAISTSLITVTFNQENTDTLAEYGVDKIVNISLDGSFSVAAYSANLAAVAKEENATIVIINGTANGKYVGPVLATKIDAAYLSNVVSLPESYDPLTVKRSCFTNKAFNHTESHKSVNIISLAVNSFGLHPKTSTPTREEKEGITTESALAIDKVEKTSNTVTIADADIVVSGGRGLKGPENWGLVENLATVLGAATACSKPVSDMGWRPHSEHVGQTGKPVATNLYIAIGISGAIQHIAGINASKVKVVINNDPEAPFFKAADYGVVGDAFEIVPKLTEKLQALKG